MRKQQIVKIDPEQYNELQKSIATILKEFTGVKQKINPFVSKRYVICKIFTIFSVIISITFSLKSLI